ncbi:uncharacterized protein BXZ73DRAFT_104232 [Epithele typhae]|uniref:uncharacterized protein n=1 Tax=Epithele typhae TaxID=378194 RepID=UPI002007D8D4|nr:uncharacterized protein BXZ73DRAFT_104232 [Epithele typhae]KAH9921974.1 hypothetical protein BXZ73DRAFT_104232 [Epithele typhae]
MKPGRRHRYFLCYKATGIQDDLLASASMRSLLCVLASVAVAAAVPYQEYILAPPSRTVHPVSVHSHHGSLSSSNTLVGGPSSKTSIILNGFNSSITYDFGKNIGGWVNLDVSSHKGSVGVTFSESSLWISSEHCDATADAGFNETLVFNITHAGHYSAPNDQERVASAI